MKIENLIFRQLLLCVCSFRLRDHFAIFPLYLELHILQSTSKYGLVAVTNLGISHCLLRYVNEVGDQLEAIP